MNNFVFTALATTLVGATSFASDTAWPELESELAALNNAPLTQDAGGPYVNGWLIGALNYNADAKDSYPDGDNNAQGFGIQGARINLSGSVGSNYGYKIGFDFTDSGELWGAGFGAAASSDFGVGDVGAGTSGAEADLLGLPDAGGIAGLTDAYATFAIGEGISGKMGAFRTPFLRSSLIDRNDTLFVDRSFLGALFSGRDAGIAVSGEVDRIHWEVALQNGADGNTEGWRYAGRVDMDVMGSSSNVEGAYNSADGTNLNIGIAIADDSSDILWDGTNKDVDFMNLALDATLTMSGMSLFAELVEGEHTGPKSSTPFSVGGSYLFGENYEVAARYDDWDTPDSDSRYTVGVNRYINGHDAKWQVSYSGGSTDRPGNDDPVENAVLTIGLALGF